MNKDKENNTNFDERTFQQYTKMNTKLPASDINIKLKMNNNKTKNEQCISPSSCV